MEYRCEILKQQRQKAQDELVEIYLRSKTMHEFLVASEIEVPSAPWHLMLAFKAYAFKKSHLNLYWLLCIFGFASVFAFSMGLFIGAKALAFGDSISLRLSMPSFFMLLMSVFTACIAAAAWAVFYDSLFMRLEINEEKISEE